MTMKSNADDDHAVDDDGGNGDDEVNRDDDQDRPPVSPTRLSSDWVAINRWIIAPTPIHYSLLQSSALQSTLVQSSTTAIHRNTLKYAPVKFIEMLLN